MSTKDKLPNLEILKASQDYLDNKVNNLKSAVGNSAIEFTDDYYIDLGGTTTTLTPVSHNQFRYAVVDCKEGDLFTINALGGGAPRAFGFADSSDPRNIIEVVNTGSEIHAVVCAPKGAAKLIINDKKVASNVCYYGEYVKDTIRRLRNSSQAPEWYAGYVANGVMKPGLKSGSNNWLTSRPITSEYGFRFKSSLPCRWIWYDKDTGEYVSGVAQQTSGDYSFSTEYEWVLSVNAGTDDAVAEEIRKNIYDYVSVDFAGAQDAPFISFLPLTDVYVGDVQQRIYFNELARYNEGDGYFSISATGSTGTEVTYTDRYIEFNVSSKKTITVNIAYYVNDVSYASKSLTVHCNPAALPSKKVMFIGDSYTENGGMVKWFADHNSSTVTLYGTQTTDIDNVTYRHEGRGSWSVGDYFAASKSGRENPFYNPSTQTFDFSYYIGNDGSSYADVDVVVILLGRNNNFNTDILSSLDAIVASIKAYATQRGSGIQIVLLSANNVAADNSGAGKYLQNSHRMNAQAHAYNTAFYNHYKNSTDVSLCFANLNLDNVYDFETEQVDASIINSVKMTQYVDNVHPWNIPGLGKFGIAVNGLLRNILNS